MTDRKRQVDAAHAAIRAAPKRDPRRETEWQYQRRLAAAAGDAILGDTPTHAVPTPDARWQAEMS